jgi:hypothetical protein
MAGKAFSSGGPHFKAHVFDMIGTKISQSIALHKDSDDRRLVEPLVWGRKSETGPS